MSHHCSKRPFRVVSLDDLGFYGYPLWRLPTSLSAHGSGIISAVRRHKAGLEKSMSPVTLSVLLFIGGYYNGFENLTASLRTGEDLCFRGWSGQVGPGF